MFFSQHLTDEDLIGLAAERDLAFGALGSKALYAAKSWLGDQYELNAEALRDMGFADDEGLGDPPEFDEVLQGFTIPTLIRFDRRRQKGFRDDLVIAPSMQAVGLLGDSDGPGYIPRFDRKQGSGFKTTVLASVWGRIPDRAEAHEPHSSEGWVMALVLDSGSDMDRSAILSDENRGLMYKGMDAADQRSILATDEESHDFGDTVKLGSASLAQIIIINARRRIQGLPMLDDTQWHARLPHYEDVVINGVPQLPSVGTNGNQINLGASDPKKGFPGGGIREAVYVVAVRTEEPEEPEEPAEEPAAD
jgi:hypothetical protein